MDQNTENKNTQTPSVQPGRDTAGPAKAGNGKSGGYRIIAILLTLFLFFGAVGTGLYYLNSKGYVDIPFLTTATRAKKYYKNNDSNANTKNLFSGARDVDAAEGKTEPSGTTQPDYGEIVDIDPDKNDPDSYVPDDFDPDDYDPDYDSDYDPEDVYPDNTTKHQTANINCDLSGKIIILDAGHGGRDTGCQFPFNNPQFWECNFTLHIAEVLKAKLEASGAKVYMTRSDDSWVSLYNRLAQTHLICMDIAEQQGKLPFSSEHAAELRQMLQNSIDINEDSVASGGMGLMVGSGAGPELQELMEMEKTLDNVLFLSVHLNSSESRTLHGTQIYYVTDESIIESENRQMRTNDEFKRSDFPKRDAYYGRKNENNSLLAECLYDNIVGDIPQFETNAHATIADNYAVLREHGLTCALIETAFLSDDDDRRMLQDENVIDQIAVSICNGVETYFAYAGN